MSSSALSQPLKPAILIYNADAGSSTQATPDDLVLALHAAGYEANYRPTKEEGDLDAALADAHGVVFVAGGDGSVRGVALRLLDKPGVQLALFPMGTSNNIAATLDITGKPLELAARYAAGHEVSFDVGHIQAPWGQDDFLEACGCGIFADVLAAYDPTADKSPLRAVQALATTLPGYHPQDIALTLDGQEVPETPLTILEVMNIRATGNGMKLGTNADPSDGKLDVVRVDAEHRDSLLAYATALARDDFEALPSVQSDAVRRVSISYHGQAFHVDGEVRPAVQAGAGEKASGTVEITVRPGALRVLLPGPTTG